MPLVATVGNVRIRVYLNDTGRHSRAHFHAASPDAEMVIGLPELDPIAGELPLASRRAVLDWAKGNIDMLVTAWNMANPAMPTQLSE